MPETPGGFVPRTAAPAPEQLRAARQAWRERPEGLRPFPVGIAATVTVDPLLPFLGAALQRLGLGAVFHEAGFGAVFQACIEGPRGFGLPAESAPGLLLALWRIDDLLPQEFLAYAHGDDEALARALETLDQLARALGGLRAQAPGLVFTVSPPFPQDLEIDLRDITHAARAGRFHRAVAEHWLLRVAEVPGVELVDAEALQRDLGVSQSTDRRTWLLYRQPYTQAYWFLLAEEIARVAAVKLLPAKKCVAVDCDNTLWGGVLGEEGLAGIHLGEDYPGSAFRLFQRQLLELQRRGVLLAVVSKNNEAQVREVFERHDAMVLKLEHIAAFRVNWRPKPDNLREIARELNIRTDALVFLDDHPAEVAEVRAQCPEILALQVPEEPEDIPGLLPAHRLFDRLHITREDRERTAMIQANQARVALSESLPREEFLAGLGTRVEVFRAGAGHVERTVQLINKTNQFNLTTRRRTREEVERLLADPAWRVFALECADRFGDHGLVAVAVVALEGELAALDTFLMSCRVLGRGVESAFLAVIAGELRAAGAREMRAEFLPTASNAPAAEFLPGHGFVREGAGWRAALEALPGVPGHISACVKPV